MVLSFQESTFVYNFGSRGTELTVVSDNAACQFATDCETVHACTMFNGKANVQVRTSCIFWQVLVTLYFCAPACLTAER